MLRSQPSLSILIAQRLTAYLINLDSFLNPILYCWKIREIRQAVKGTFLKTFCFFFLVEQAQINEVEYIKVHTATRWTIRHGLMLLWFADLMNVTEEVTIHRPNVSTLLSSAFIRVDLNAATRGPFISSLISGLFFDEV